MYKSIILFTTFTAQSFAKDVTGVTSNSLWSRPIAHRGPVASIAEEHTKKPIPKGTNEEKSFLDAVRMPGTDWCGKGWRTDSYQKLGGFSDADRCCRQHDLGCPISIQPGETKYALTNMRFHTVMHCTCDDRFRSCLKMTSSKSGDIVGNLFFNIANIPCFVFKKAEVCVERNWWGSCLQTKVIDKAQWRLPIHY